MAPVLVLMTLAEALKMPLPLTPAAIIEPELVKLTVVAEMPMFPPAIEPALLTLAAVVASTPAKPPEITPDMVFATAAVSALMAMPAPPEILPARGSRGLDGVEFRP